MTLQSPSRANSWQPQCLKMCSVEIWDDGCPLEDSQHLLHSVDRLIIDESGWGWERSVASWQAGKWGLGIFLPDELFGTTSLWSPLIWKIWFNITSAVSLAVGSLGKAMKWAILENLSTTVNIFSVTLWHWKSCDKMSQGLQVTGRGCRSPAYGFCYDLLRADTLHIMRHGLSHIVPYSRWPPWTRSTWLQGSRTAERNEPIE